MKRVMFSTVLVLIFTGWSSAQDLRSMQVAQNLGGILASERDCELSYDQTAIEAFIEENVEATDMGFASQLNLFTDGVKYDLEDMSTSEKTAHCAQIKRVARSFGFIE